MNDYIKTLKENLKGYYTAVRSIDAYSAHDTERFVGEELEKRQAESSQKRADALNKFKRQATEDFSSLKSRISKASFINPQTTQTDVFQMFSNDTVELTPREIQIYLDKANEEHDFTTLRAIQKYSDKHKLNLRINTADDVINAYEEFYGSALKMANSINNDISKITDSHVECFADEDFGKELHDTVGNALFPGGSLSDTYAHAYDNVGLNTEDSQINFNFSSNQQ